MYDLILIRYGEISLKGDNRPFFINKLMENIKKSCEQITPVQVKKERGRIYLYPEKKEQELLDKLKKIPGIVSFSPVIEIELDYEKIKENALKILRDEINENKKETFKVETNRANKSFPKNSMEINRELGDFLLNNIDQLTVDIHNPDYKLQLDIRKNNIYMFTRKIPGPGGLPVGTGGKGLLLLSGGIDSPVAGWLALKRGLKIEALHFHSFPYTSERARQKVIDLASVLSQTGLGLKLYLASFTEIQRAIKQNCNQKYIITIMRRMMLRIACQIAKKNNNQVLLTGESIGQVSSQTLENISVISEVSSLPILRPLITMDKQEIINIAQQINTYKISTLPHEDCCTLFVPRHPAIKPPLDTIKYNESKFDYQKLIKEVVENIEILNIEE